MGGIMTAFIAAHAAGTIAELYNADSLKIELPLSDGLSPVVDIEPQQPEFKGFVRHCIKPVVGRPDPITGLYPVPEDSIPTGPTNQATDGDLQFKGTAAEFVKVFPEYLQRATAKLGLDARRFKTELDFIVENVGDCAHLTPGMAQSARGDLSRLARGRYTVCGRGRISASDAVPQDAWSIDMNLSDLQRGRMDWSTDQPFFITIFFTPPRMRRGGPYYIVSAMIERSQY
jgi:hypothetical protein